MMRMAMSSAAAALLRALAARAGVDRNRILLTEACSTDWRSLTFSGERHRLTLRITGSDAAAVADKMCAGLEDQEFDLPRLIVADIIVAGEAVQAPSGAVELVIEALTVASD